MKSVIDFPHHWLDTDNRPKITACGFCGKKIAWISLEFKGVMFSSMCSKSLVRSLRKINRERH